MTERPGGKGLDNAPEFRWIHLVLTNTIFQHYRIAVLAMGLNGFGEIGGVAMNLTICSAPMGRMYVGPGAAGSGSEAPSGPTAT
ncbi:MAG TPA: hypothetical protein VG028_17955 [Terriglobia bacterium]|nr:hypothetical protein [Terriglobia bacterium]